MLKLAHSKNAITQIKTRLKQKEGSIQQGDERVLNAIKSSRIILPIFLGLLVVAYLIWRQVDLEALESIQWNQKTTFWLGLAVLCYILRHAFYSWRLRILSDKEFSWSKSAELITIWEFSSAVSPTSIGGSAVALFLLAQEKLSSAKTVSVVLYSMVLDTLFFLVTIPLLIFVFGAQVLRPEAVTFADLGIYGGAVILVLALMLIYGGLFAYGLFVKPQAIQRILFYLSRRKWLRRFEKDLRKTGQDIVMTSEELSQKNFVYHIKAITATAGAWSLKFFAINLIITALVVNIPTELWSQFLRYGRAETMYSITQFIPTPGGAGAAEYIFGGFFSDFVPLNIAIVVALTWRLITYYPYLIAGTIVVPNWLRKVLNRRNRSKRKHPQKG